MDPDPSNDADPLDPDSQHCLLPIYFSRFSQLPNELVDDVSLLLSNVRAGVDGQVLQIKTLSFSQNKDCF